MSASVRADACACTSSANTCASVTGVSTVRTSVLVRVSGSVGLLGGDGVAALLGLALFDLGGVLGHLADYGYEPRSRAALDSSSIVHTIVDGGERKDRGMDIPKVSIVPEIFSPIVGLWSPPAGTLPCAPVVPVVPVVLSLLLHKPCP